MKLSKTLFSLSLLSLSVSTFAAKQQDIEKVTVYGDFHQRALAQLSASASIIDNARIQSRQAEHIEDLLRIAPNVNFATGASRGRFVQIRGIGERSQYAEPINPSVSIMVDDFDFTGLGAAALLFDTQQVEIFRGPQATVFGTGALAGAVLIKSTQAGESDADYVQLTAATKSSYRVEAGKSVEVADNLALRGALVHNQSDGFVRNTFLNRDDTNNIDESAIRLAASYDYSDEVSLTVNYRWYDIDNGFDAFSLDNTRETLSDEPGFDRQQTHAISANLLTRLGGGDLHFIVTHASHNIGYAYDEDWTFDGFHPWGYTSFDAYYRDVDTNTVELRFVSGDQWRLFNDTTSWVIGSRVKNNKEDLLRQYTYADGDFVSQYQPITQAVYGQLESQLTSDLLLTFALRAENYDFSYGDNAGLNGEHDSTMLGGKLALSYQLGQQLVYASISRGYKGAGINPDQNVSTDNRFYDEEYNWNYEIGMKGRLADQLTSRLAFFIMKREDTQVSDYELQYRDDGSAEFIDIISNADLGTNQGVEVELSWQATDNWNLSFSGGYLDAYYEDYTRADGITVTEQQQAQAPEFTANLLSQLDFNESIRWNVEVDFADRYRFSDGHDVTAPSRTLVHTQLSWRIENWETQLWINNAFDETYYTRGFGGFSNDPRDFYEFDEPYYQLGNGRQTGVTVRYQFQEHIMQVMVELSLYPLVNDYIGPIKAFIERLNSYSNLTVITCSTSTQVHGDYTEVMQVLGAEMQRTHEEVGQAVFVAKFLNFDAMSSKQDRMEQILSQLVEQIVATSLAEWLAVVLAIAYVLLAARQSAWCWLAALTSTAIYTWLFWQVALPFQSALNLFYMIMAVYGYWQWHHKPGENKSVQSRSLSWHVLAVFGLTAVAVGLGKLAATQFNSEYLWLDAAINVFSVATTFMVAHKILQNWIYWFVINTAAVFLYWQSGLILSACLFLGYVGFSVYGYNQWKQEWSERYLTNS